MTTTLFTPNGDGYDIAPAGVLILLASYAKETPRLVRHIKDMLTAARAGGFAQSDILETLLLVNGENSPRVNAMAVQACEAAGNDAISRIFDAMRGHNA